MNVRSTRDITMIDVTFLRDNPKVVGILIKKKDPTFDVEKLLALDIQVRNINVQVEELRFKKNELAQQAKSGVTPELREKSILVGKNLKSKETQLEEVRAAFDTLLYSCPNIPLADVLEGGKEQNKVVREIGKKPVFTFTPKNHVELGEQNKFFNFEIGTKVAASNFVWYEEQGVKLIYALAMFMLKNNIKHGFRMMLPPYFANAQTLTVSGNFPKFKEDGVIEKIGPGEAGPTFS